jgi:hypothetical protein
MQRIEREATSILMLKMGIHSAVVVLMHLTRESLIFYGALIRKSAKTFSSKYSSL